MERHDEIQSWLNFEAPEDLESFVILDDIEYFGHLQDKLVNTSFPEGLQEEHVKKAIRILNGET